MSRKWVVEDAEIFMRDHVLRLASLRQDLCDKSGLGFWPTPAIFPLLLAKCLAGLQEVITGLYLDGNLTRADILADCRCDLIRLVDEGDLGENHTRLFLESHTALFDSWNPTEELPFQAFCTGMSDICDPLILFGALMRNEEGSPGEVAALLDSGLISEGEFADLHILEEEEHAVIAEGIKKRLGTEEAIFAKFLQGYASHDEIYASISGC